MSLATIIQRRQRALIAAWVQNPLIQVQAESPSALGSLVYLDDGSGGGAQQLGRRSASNVALVRRGADPDSGASVWVAASYGSYQGAYLSFIRETYGQAVTPADLAGYNVDHLLNRARSPLGSSFIRLEAIPAAANQDWGRLFEKAASDPRFSANQQRERRTMSWVICAKLAGELPPRGPDDQAGIQRLVSFFTRIGLDAGEAREGLTSMLQFAYKFR